MQYKQNYVSLITTAESKKDCSIKHFRGVDKKYPLTCIKYKIIIP